MLAAEQQQQKNCQFELIFYNEVTAHKKIAGEKTAIMPLNFARKCSISVKHIRQAVNSDLSCSNDL